jgi:hypothetical protein
MKLSNLSETLIGSEIVKLGGEIRETLLRKHIYKLSGLNSCLAINFSSL